MASDARAAGAAGGIPQPSGGGSQPRTGLLIDWGGVLTSDLFASFTAFCRREGLADDAIAKALSRDPAARELLVALETGALARDRFELGLAALLGVRPEQLIDRLLAEVRPDRAMIGAVARARSLGIRTCLVSNSWALDHYDRPLLQELFDATVISAEVGMRKPAPQMYTRAAEALGLAPARCVYVDDLEFNLTPAVQLGMATVHHKRAEQTIPALEGLLALPAESLRAA